jgi:hypothetical protein
MSDRLRDRIAEGSSPQEARFGDWDQAAQALALMRPAHLERFFGALASHWAQAGRDPAELTRVLERALARRLESEHTAG